MRFAVLLPVLTLLGSSITAVSAADHKSIRNVSLDRRMSMDTSDPAEAKLDDPYKEAGFRTTPYQAAHSAEGQILEPLEESARNSRYSRFIHHDGAPVFLIQEVEPETIRQSRVDLKKIFYHYRDLENDRLVIWEMEPDRARVPYPDVQAQIVAKIHQKDASTSIGLPRDVVDLLHGMPFSASEHRNWFGLHTSPWWRTVKEDAREIFVEHAADSAAPKEAFDRLRVALQQYGMVKLTNRESSVRFALRLDKLGNVEYKSLKAVV